MAPAEPSCFGLGCKACIWPLIMRDTGRSYVVQVVRLALILETIDGELPRVGGPSERDCAAGVAVPQPGGSPRPLPVRPLTQGMEVPAYTPDVGPSSPIFR